MIRIDQIKYRRESMLQTYSVTNTRNERHIYRPYNRVFGFCPKITAYDVSIPVLNTHTHTHTHT